MSKHLTVFAGVLMCMGLASSPAGGQGTVAPTHSGQDLPETPKAAPKPPRSAAVMHLSPEERVKFGWGEEGFGPKRTRKLRHIPEMQLAEMAQSGDAEAAYILWQLLQSDQRLDEAERVALEQGRVNGHTFLIATMAARYQSESNPRGLVLYRLCAKMGDAVCARKYQSATAVWKPDEASIESEAAALLRQLGRQ